MRCFVALPIPEAAREAIIGASGLLRENWPGLSWSGPETFHLTLAFLGEQGPAGAAAARAALASLRESSAVDFALSGFVQFPPRGPWRVLAAEIQTNSPPIHGEDALVRLYRRVNEALAREAERNGLEPLNAEWPDASDTCSRPRRPFHAHITIARQPSVPRLACPPSDAALDPLLLGTAKKILNGNFRFEALVLYKSELRPRGAIYTELERVALA